MYKKNNSLIPGLSHGSFSVLHAEKRISVSVQHWGGPGDEAIAKTAHMQLLRAQSAYQYKNIHDQPGDMLFQNQILAALQEVYVYRFW